MGVFIRLAVVTEPTRTGSGAIMVDDGCKCTPEGVDVFTLYSEDLETMSLERLLQFVSLEIIGGMACDGDVVVINQELNVQALRNGKTSSLCIVTLLLRTIGTETKDDFIPVGEGDTVYVWPHVAKTTRRELDAWSEAEFGVAGELGVCLTVMQEVFWGNVAFHGRQEVLCCDTVACGSGRQAS